MEFLEQMEKEHNESQDVRIEITEDDILSVSDNSDNIESLGS